MKTLILRYTVPLEIEVPDDFPVTTAEIEKTVDWRRNDYRDGRHPFASELLHDAALRAARNDLDSAIDNHYCRRIEEHFGAQNAGNWHMEARDALIKRCLGSLGYIRLVNGGTVEVAAMWHPLTQRYTYAPHTVICRADTKPDGSPGDFELATRTVFEGREAAEAYAAGIAPAREPIVVAMPLDELRVGEERGRLDYWHPTGAS
jgi:hypothetical protein